MAKRKKAQEAPAYDPGARDQAMARLAASRSCAQAAIEAIDEALALFVNPDEDDDASERTEIIEAAIDAAGMMQRALEAASGHMERVDPEACEPWDEDGDDDDDDDAGGD